MEEKKVEYIELIYDLIFVYIVGRNNELLHVIHNGFIAPTAFLTYLLTALIILQIWYYTTLFINRYGENDKLMYVGIFVNITHTLWRTKRHVRHLIWYKRSVVPGPSGIGGTDLSQTIWAS